MPRFAANLSFNPIEPLKPSSSQSSSSKSSTGTKPPVLQPSTVPTETVPEAEFDWNSSGLVNPLDGELNSSVTLLLLRSLVSFYFRIIIASVPKNTKSSMESKAILIVCDFIES